MVIPRRGWLSAAGAGTKLGASRQQSKSDAAKLQIFVINLLIGGKRFVTCKRLSRALTNCPAVAWTTYRRPSQRSRFNHAKRILR